MLFITTFYWFLYICYCLFSYFLMVTLLLSFNQNFNTYIMIVYLNFAQYGLDKSGGILKAKLDFAFCHC